MEFQEGSVLVLNGTLLVHIDPTEPWVSALESLLWQLHLRAGGKGEVTIVIVINHQMNNDRNFHKDHDDDDTYS